jgi:hypothetical protein
VTLRRRLVALAALLVGVASAAGAQVRVPQPTPSPRAPGVRAPGDTLRTRRDSTAKVDTVGIANFAAPDSVMERLMSMPGYTVTRYQAEVITFDAETRALVLAKRALVLRDSQVVKSDTIVYSGTGSAIRVGSGSAGRNVFVTPGQAPVISSGPGTYDITSRRAVVSNVRTSLVENGQTLIIAGERVVIAAKSDSLKSANDATYYLKDGMITACEDSIPDYYFKAGEIKRTGSFVVARPAVLYIGDVPVFWLPFLFQDVRSGRHSGILSPNLGISDFVRNSKSYRRNVEGLGYYVAINDFLDAQAFFDWRSSAGASDLLQDPGFVRYNGEVRYRWLERYVTGNLALSQTIQSNLKNTAVSWAHQENFTRNSSLTTNVNYVTSTQLQRQTTVNPYTALATISSQANYQQKVGPMQFSIGGTQKQYPGRDQIDKAYPTVSMTSSPLNLASWLTWTPNLSYSSTKTLNIDQPTALGLLLRDTTIAGRDSIVGDTLKRSAYQSSFSFDTPVQIFGYDLGNRITLNSARNDFPERAIVTDVNTGIASERIYATTYSTQFDWTPSFTLPPVARNKFNLTPQLSLQNIDGGSPLMVRNERTGGQWVSQGKRPTFGLSASPTLFGLFGGFGPFTRIRHSITPVFGYTFSPAAQPKDEFLAAIGRTKVGYLGGFAQNSLSFQLSTNVEAKTRSRNDSNPESGEKLKLISVNFTGLNYDFERAKQTHSRLRGLTTETFGYTIRSDLLPGVDIGSTYSLFRGSTLSDTAKFEPFRTGINASVSFSNTANPFAVFARLFGRAVPLPEPAVERIEPAPDDRYARQVASQPVAGRSARTAAFLPNVTNGWKAAFTFTSSRQRPPSAGALNVVAFDPASRCTQFDTPTLRLAFDECVARARTNPSPEVPITSGLIGAPVFLVPPSTSLNSDLSFNVTEHWAASWQTNYDFVQRSFASQIVSLQRDLHDWRAIFAFTQSPTGSFAFNFLISLKAEPDLKFDYHKATYRNQGLSSTIP